MVVDPDEAANPAPSHTPSQTQTASLPEPPSLPLPSPLNPNRLLDLLDGPPPPPPQVLVAVQSNSDPGPPDSSNTNTAGSNVGVSARERSATESSTDNTQEAEDDSDDDDYDGQLEFLDRFKEDKSVPSEEEAREIEAIPEKNAVDHEHWQKAVFTPLDDPEYVPGESGIITWTLEGFHGTRQNPNKKRIMRSPVVAIGGYKWNIKVFPHGNEGTDHLSVYIECTGEGSVSEDDEMQATVTEGAGSPELSPNDSKASQNHSSEGTIDPPKPWDVAAQIGCVMYNLEEPRACVFEKATHHFEDASQDWGWVRFYGPWSSIHQRRHLQRKPVLQNDSLTFTAFVRVVKDPTKALWWRPVDQSTWDSIAKTGYRGLSAEEPASYSFVASLAPWLHLKSLRDLVLNLKIPDSVQEPLYRTRPLFEQLQEVIYKKYSPKASSDAVSLFQLQQAFDWHEHSFVNSSDVIEIWESLRNIMNIECHSQDPSGPKRDILEFIWTIRQNVPPPAVLPASSQAQASSGKEPHSIQEILHDVMQDKNAKYKPWEGWTHRNEGFPDVLQVELHRQKYDTFARKWRKMTHKIKLDDSVVFNEVQYTLFSIIIHKGELGSGRFYSVVRPGGPNSPWVRYKSSVTSYLTHRQAVESHEGKGEERYGSESVAYIAIYVASEKLDILAPVPEDRSPTGVLGPITREQKPPRDLSTWNSVPVIVHNSQSFKTRKSTGLLDPWSTSTTGRYELTVSPSATLADVQEELVTKCNAAANPEQCRLWPMKTTANTIRFLPPFEQFLAPRTKLIDFAERTGGIHLWLHVIPLELVVEPVAVPSPPAEPFTSNSLVPRPVSSDSSTPASQAADGQDVAMGGTQEQSVGQTNAGDRQTQPPPALPVIDPPSDVYAPEPPREKQWQLQDQLYILVKKFDPETQAITGLDCFFVSPNERIYKSVPQLAQVSPPFKAYHEIDTVLDEPEIAPEATFSTACLLNGSIIVVQPDNLSEAKAEELRKQGNALTVPDFFQTQTFLSHFSYQGPVHVASYFGGPYTYAPLRNGRFFGLCTMIDDTTGDAYVGNCMGGYKSGKGVMHYANGDTYTGDWAHSSPEGQGTMVYNTTGNTYVGGWKAGRRHGKGVMNFEVADEELQLCKICYENEMDALFYRCGHVASCEMCARQVRDCPVCRRPVDAVVRIWKT